MMPILSWRQHFEFGYNGIPFNFRSSATDQWWVRYGVCSDDPLIFREECMRTARRIREVTSKDIWVLFSGGVDSEVALQSFVHAQIPVRAAILRFRGDLNIHDISYAVIACDRWKVPYKIFDLDLEQFWTTRALDYARPTYCVSPQLLTTMYLADQVEGYPVLGSGECLLVKDMPESASEKERGYPKTDWHLWEKEKIAAWYRHFMVRGRDACPGFFQFTPEIILSYLNDGIVRSLTEDKYWGKLTTESLKLKIYQQHFELFSRPKYTGFEKVQDLDALIRNQLLLAFPDSNQVHKTRIQDLRARLSPKSAPVFVGDQPEQ